MERIEEQDNEVLSGGEVKIGGRVGGAEGDLFASRNRESKHIHHSTLCC